MKIAYLLATRGNPRMAGACIETARFLASGKHDLEFLVGIDRDDKASIKYFWDNYPEVIVSIDDRVPALGTVWNRLASVSTASALCAMNDHAFISTPNWDEGVAKFCPEGSVSVVGFEDSAAPGMPTYPVVSRGWYELAGLYTDHFPFWFDDTWLAETWHFMTGNHVYISNQIRVINKHSKTRRMRDLKFWWTFYASMRPKRIAEAARVRAFVGVEPLSKELIDLIRREYELRDDQHLIRAAEIESAFSSGVSLDPKELSLYNEAVEAAQSALRFWRAA